MTLIFSLTIRHISFPIHSFPFSHVVFKQSDSHSRYQYKDVKGKGNMSTYSHARCNLDFFFDCYRKFDLLFNCFNLCSLCFLFCIHMVCFCALFVLYIVSVCRTTNCPLETNKYT